MPAVSPDGHWIAFVSDRDSVGGPWELYVVRPDGSGVRRVTQTPADEFAPHWSRDGREIVTMTASDDSTALWAIHPDGTGRRCVVARPAKGLALSHDGRRIAYAVGSWTVNRLMVANVDGSGATALTDSADSWFNLQWSPDDRKIAVTHGDSTRRLTIVVMNADGSNRRTVMRLAAEHGSPQWPMWSADGRHLAVQAGRYDRQDHAKSSAHIWTLDLASGAATRLDPHADGRLDETPAWFPDGRRIAFQSDRTGAFEIWTMRADGSDVRRVTR